MFKKMYISCVTVLSVVLVMSGCASTEKAPISKNNVTPLTSMYSFQIIESSSHDAVSVDQLATNLQNTDVVFIGEFHSHQGSHLLQLQLLEALYKKNPNLILSMEQFTRDSQTVLNKYLSNEYGESTLINEGNAWDHYKGSYRAIVEFAREHNIPVIAANAPAMHVRCVGKKGVDAIADFPKEQASWSANKLDLENELYKEKFLSFIRSSGRSHGQTPAQQEARAMKTYAAQLLRDTTMAESIMLAMAQNPDAQVVHLNGSFHSDNHLGTVVVLQSMKPNIVTSVLSPVMVEDNMKPEVKPEQYAQGDYLYLLRQMPDRYKNKDKQMASISKLIKNRMKEKCEF